MYKLPNTCQKLKNGIYVNLATMKMFDFTNFERSKAIFICTNGGCELISYKDFQKVLIAGKNVRYLGNL
jgi:hypothetical protein